MDRGGGNLIGLNLRGSLSHLCQDLLDLGIGCAVIRFRVVLLIPQADSDSFSSVRGNQDQFVLKACLLSKQWKDFVFQCPVKLCNAMGASDAWKHYEQT